MKSNLKFAIVTTLLAGLLTACPTPPPAPVISSVTVTGAPADNNIKMNVPVPLTASALDSSGTAIAGATFTWVSSNPDAVSVDAAGVVTAKKFGIAIITASSGGISGATASQTTYGLEAVFGTYVSRAVTSTARTLRFRSKTGQPIAANTTFNIVITGPSGWNNNQPQNQTFTTGTSPTPIYTTSGNSTITPISGLYKMTTTYLAESFESMPNTIDASLKMPTTTITISSASNSAVSANWTAVAGASFYDSFAWNSTGGSSLKYAGISATNTTADISGLTLDKTKNPEFGVVTLNFDYSNLATINLPNQIIRSFTYASIVLP